MINGQEILNGLLEKRVTIETEHADIETEFQRIAERKANVVERLNAIDIVIKEFNGNIGEEMKLADRIGEIVEANDSEGATDKTDSEPFELKPKQNGHKPRKKRQGGLKNTARKKFNELPNEFTKNDLADILIREHPELKGKVNENTLRGVVLRLVQDGQAKIKTPSVGPVPQLYEKI